MGERKETQDWVHANGFAHVIDPMRGGYVEGFDRAREYQFMRADWDEPHVFKMADQHPAMNRWGLYYRPLT